LTTEERAELATLRKDNRELRTERDILKKPRAFSPRTKRSVRLDRRGEARVPVAKLCQYLQVSPSGFYASRRRPESAHTQADRRLRVLVRASFDESRQRYGSPRIHDDLIEQAEHVSRKRVIRLMQEDGLEARARKRLKGTTMSNRDQPVPRISWIVGSGRPARISVGSAHHGVRDRRKGKLYLAVVLDLFSALVVVWAVSAVNGRHVTIKALDMALEANGITCSMSRRGSCYDTQFKIRAELGCVA
jgi:putative transposase